MRTEAKCPPEERYLWADITYSDATIQQLQADYVRNTNAKRKGEAYYKFINWKREPIEILVYTWYAYADFELPKSFNCIFDVNNPANYVIIAFELTQCIFNGWFPVESISHGHKHICVLRFEQEVPAIINSLYQQADGNFDLSIMGNRLGFCDAQDLPAITARKEKDAQLKQQYGANWIDYYDE